MVKSIVAGFALCLAGAVMAATNVVSGVTVSVLGGAGEGFVEPDVVPAAVVGATCEMARELLIGDRTAAPPGEGIMATQTSEASHTDTGGTSSQSSTTYCKRDTRPILSRVAQAMLAKYGAPIAGGSGAVRLVRV